MKKGMPHERARRVLDCRLEAVRSGFVRGVVGSSVQRQSKRGAERRGGLLRTPYSRRDALRRQADHRDGYHIIACYCGFGHL